MKATHCNGCGQEFKPHQHVFIAGDTTWCMKCAGERDVWREQ